jgi:hypothetical protein
MFSASRRRASFVPRLERLDDRIVPAGTLKTTFSLGVLTITAVDSANPTQNNQNIALLGASQGHVSISAQDGETIVGRNSFNHVATLVVNMRAGDDTVTISDLKLARRGNTVKINGGDGNNTLLFDGLNVNIDTLRVTNGTGTFTMTDAASVKMNFGAININCPKGANDILLGGLAVARTTTVVTGANADDLIQIDNASFGGKFTLLSGGGNDTVEMGMIKPKDEFEVIFSAAVLIDLGAGDDSLTAGVNVHDYDPKDPPNFVRFQGGPVVMNGGTGNDTINVHHPRSTEFSTEGDPTLDNWENIIYHL